MTMEYPEPSATPVRARPLARAGSLCAVLLLLGACAQLPSFGGPGSQRASGPPAAPAAAEKPLARAELVGRAQHLLTELGYQPGPVDGLPGPRTNRAVSAFQGDSGLPVDGKVSRALLAQLEAARAAQATSPGPKAPGAPAAKDREPAAADSASASTSSASSIRLTRDALPSYETGSTFVYSDGRVEKVVSLKGATVRWSGRDGSRFTSHRNFLLPWSYWRAGGERGTAELGQEPEALWPLAGGTPVYYSARIVVQQEEGEKSLVESNERWRCALAGRETVAVMAGTFESYRFECERKATGDTPGLKRVWYYAPAVRHYVRFDEISDTAAVERLVELVAIRPDAHDWPPIARAALDRAVEQALDEAPDGEARPWSSSGVETQVTIQPTSRFESTDGKPCRTFLLSWSGSEDGAGGQRRYPGAACRSPLGAWEIPGLEGDPDSNLAISQNMAF